MAEAFILNNGINTDDATATSAKIMSGYTAYVKGEKITGTGFATTTNATAATIRSGYKAYDNKGNLITGTGYATTTTATTANIMNGKTAYSNSGTLLTGTGFATTTNATAATIRSGYKAYSNTGTLITGTGYATTTTASASTILSGYTAYSNTGTLLTGTNPGVKTGTVTISANSQTATVSGLGFTPTNAVIFIDGAYTGTSVTVDVVMCASRIGSTYRLALTNQHSYCYSYNYLYNYTSSSYLAVTFASGSVTFTTQDITYGYFYATTYRYVIW